MIRVKRASGHFCGILQVAAGYDFSQKAEIKLLFLFIINITADSHAFNVQITGPQRLRLNQIRKEKEQIVTMHNICESIFPEKTVLKPHCNSHHSPTLMQEI